jgi:predicted methyltransferase
MKLLPIVLAIAAVAGCSKKKEPPPADKASGAMTGSSMTGSGSGDTMSGHGSGSAMAGSGSGSSMAGSGSGAGSGSAAAIEIKPYTPAADVSQPIKDAIAATDRDDHDRAIDAGRKPGEVLQFFKVAPGQKIAELFSGGGATTELLARVVGDKGHVYAQNSKEYMDKFLRKPWEARAGKPMMKNVTMNETADFNAPFPADAKDLDAVIIVLNYHDLYNNKTDLAKMNKAVFKVLKKGGIYGIEDHSAPKGDGTKDTNTTHRIDEDIVKKDVLAAGFKLDGESDVLRNKDDKRDWNASPRDAGDKRGTSDRFVLRFVKP